jgi:Flp pilus assembly protein TadG
MNPSKHTLRQWCGRLRGGAIHRFAAENSGMAAVEFAMIAPVMIALYFGVTEITDAYDAHTKATAVASTAADLIAQEKIVCDAEMDDAFSALNAIMYPYTSTDMKITISSLIDNGNNTVKVAWSDAQNATPRPVNSSVTIPSGLVAAGGSVILAEVDFTYHSPTPFFFPVTTPMTDKYYLHPRKTDQIGRETTCT